MQPVLGQDPASTMIRRLALQQWRLIALNVGSSVIQAFTEGLTLAVVFLSVEVLATPVAGFNWDANPLVGWWPAAVDWLTGLPTTAVFLSLLVLAVLIQALQSVSSFLNKVSVGYFSARLTALMTARIHSQVLSFSFPCASSYRVGDLTRHANRGPDVIRRQIEITSTLLVNVLMAVTYLAVLVGISPWLLLAVLLMGSMTTLLQKCLVPRIRAGSKGLSQALVEISSRITEDFMALRLHSSGQLDVVDQRFRSRIGELERQLRAQARRLSVLDPFSSFLPILAIAIIGALSLVLLGGLNTGVLPSLVTFVLALQRLNMRLSALAGAFSAMADNSAGLERLSQILSRDDKEFRSQGGTPFHGLEQAIRFEQVDLQYAPELPGLKFNFFQSA